MEEEVAPVAPAVEAAEVVYRMKTVQFLGRQTPIVLQNDNGPCPLLAISNVLLLRNVINLSPDLNEVSQQRLLYLIAERLLDSNSNVKDKDEEYVNNQQQNISDAIDLLPRLATGIDVNVHFRKINDFEFTRECAIFDLLDIPLYHGWIVDPQDAETASAIGSKSYNTVVAELVDYQARKSMQDSVALDDSVDFAAATTAALGVPSPAISRAISFDKCSVSIPVEQKKRYGDREEEEELMRVLDLSKLETVSNVNAYLASGDPPVSLMNSHANDSEKGDLAVESNASMVPSLVELNSSDISQSGISTPLSSSNSDEPDHIDELNLSETRDEQSCRDCNNHDNSLAETTNAVTPAFEKEAMTSTSDQSKEVITTELSKMQSSTSVESMVDHLSGIYRAGSEVISMEMDKASSRDCSQVLPEPSEPVVHEMLDSICEAKNSSDKTLFNGEFSLLDGPANLTNDVSEPIYQGEEHIHEFGNLSNVSPEPMYEGENILAEQAGNTKSSTPPPGVKDDSVDHQGYLVKTFLESSASQLTIYGLFCLQDGLKERELCVFFRNNHFSTMFKYNGELYLLATDQGYMDQPDLVWEKLNEVNGDTVFMTGNFTRFSGENRSSDAWNEQQAITSTADFLATLESSRAPNDAANSDLQLAIALQQQELDQQTQHQSPPAPQQLQQTSGNHSRLVVGPQAPTQSTAPPARSNAKPKEKCSLM